MKSSSAGGSAAALGLVLVALAGCSGGASDGTAVEGRPVEQVCGGFAKGTEARAALAAVVGGNTLVEDRYEPDATLKALREADGKLTTGELANGTLYCKVRKAGDEEPAITIDFREALVVPGGRGDATFQAFRTGSEAQASDRFAKILFHCGEARASKGTGDRIVAAELERSNKLDLRKEDLVVHEVTVLNAAARAVADRLGCTDTDLVDGVPSPLAAP
ncbi:hypothetical protein [Streptomyces sp. NPDC127092]|uniref:hypothetical protein n=1 Tax=Streptomyces sp. NPDC127092 TaxID=3347135 RepID=UPI0036691443